MTFKNSIIALLFSLIFVTALSINVSHAQGIIFSEDNYGEDAELIERLSHKDAEYAMTTREGSVDFMISNGHLVLQFSDTFLADLEKELESEAGEEEGDSHFATVIKSMVTSGLRTMFDRAIAIPFTQISEVYMENDRLVIKNLEGEEMFDDMEINDTDVMEDFRARDTRRFVAEAERYLP
ncbi:MAG: hypothetical protein R3283_08075 [Balneolaceae bacterium]|nr:hypothetical protein [Balneolaceae bacterium]